MRADEASGESITSSGRRAPIHAAMTVRQVATDYPGCRAVFRRYGEPDRGSTRFGHIEPLDRFARRRGISLDRLLTELSEAAGIAAVRDDPTAEPAHRPFVAAALVVTLTLGAGWGALLLIEVGRQGSWSAPAPGEVVAHGAAQFWGFIVPFIIGVAVTFLPRTTARPRPGRVWLALLLGALLAGVVGDFAWSLALGRLPWLGLASGSAELAAALGFLAISVQQMGGKARAPWARSILASGAWMIVWAVVGMASRGRAWAAGPGAFSESERRLALELALFGFAMNAVHGFGQRLLPGMLGGGGPRRGAVTAAFVLNNLGVAALVASHVWRPSLCAALGAVGVAGGAAAWAIGMRAFRGARRSAPRPEAGPFFLVRYIQLAGFWLLAGLALLVAGEVSAALRGVEPPRAYLGATRHALTVGFLTTLILGVGQRLIPILSHDLLAWPRLVVPTFALIAVGNALRVVGELATLKWPVWFRFLPISALLELTALSLFAANAFRTMWPPPDPLLRTGRATRTTRVAVLMAEHPWLEDHLIASGIRYLERVRSVPSELTLGSLITGEGLDPETMIPRINELLNAEQQPPAR